MTQTPARGRLLKSKQYDLTSMWNVRFKCFTTCFNVCASALNIMGSHNGSGAWDTCERATQICAYSQLNEHAQLAACALQAQGVP
jgi:hypothetical protein